jgi:hypothetical protein
MFLGIASFPVTFALNADGNVERVTMTALSPVADFSWDYHDLLFLPIPARKDVK